MSDKYPSIVSSWVGHMTSVRKLLDVACSNNIDLLITGETGTGKGLIAREVALAHSKELHVVNCAAIPDTLIEAELFGVVKGAYTGADHTRPGMFQQAAGGILFLDEVGELSLTAQAKLLQALETRRVSMLGSTKITRIDCQVIAATNQDLLAMVEDGSFRRDLYYRLSGFPIHMPPLRDRHRDVWMIAERLAHDTRFALGINHEIKLSDDLRMAFERYQWPGNVREMQNVIRRAMLLTDGDKISLIDMPDEIIAAEVGSVAITMRDKYGRRLTLRKTMLDIERNLIEKAIAEVGGRTVYGWRSKAARQLGLSRTTLVEKLRRFGIAS